MVSFYIIIILMFNWLVILGVIIILMALKLAKFAILILLAGVFIVWLSKVLKRS